MSEAGGPNARLGRRLLWFLALWVAGVATVALLAMAVRVVMAL